MRMRIGASCIAAALAVVLPAANSLAQSDPDLNGPKAMLEEASPSVKLSEQRLIPIDGTDTVIRLWTENGRNRASVSRDSGSTWVSLMDPKHTLNFHLAKFNPANGTPTIPGMLQSGADAKLFIAQFVTQPIREYRAAIQALGGEVSKYLAHNAYLVRMSPDAAQKLAALPWTRFVGTYHSAYKFEPELLDAYRSGRTIPRSRFNIMMVDRKADEAKLVQAVEAAGGTVNVFANGNVLIEATLDGSQLLDVASSDTVLWIDRWSAPEHDMDLVRAQGGANYLEGQKALQYTGKGIRGHIMEGVWATHPEYGTNMYRTNPIGTTATLGDSHGNSTCAIIFGIGTQAQARGLCPDGQAYYDNYNHVYNNNNRYGLVGSLVNPAMPYQCMLQTASWGYARTTIYGSRSAEMDTIILDHDMLTTQSQSNAGGPPSRPQAWAKNIVSVGGIRHYNTASLADDAWASSGSTGPADDGRIKPDVVAFYDSIYTAGSSTGYTQFGGTSGATPIVAGHNGLLTEMITDGIYGHQPAATWQSRFAVKPKYTMTKALLINTARAYNLNTQATRFQQGWGFPSLQDAWDRRDFILATNELDVLTNRSSTSYFVWVPGTFNDLRVTTTWADTANAPTTKQPHINNNLDLRVSGPSGTYWGNNGLTTTPWSTTGGTANAIDTVENVFVQNPRRGIYEVTVSGAAIVADTHVETRVVDADFSLVVNGIGAGRDRSDMQLDLLSTSTGDLRVRLQSLPAGYTEGWVVYSLNTSRRLGMGHYFGLEADALTIATFLQPSAVGSPFHFAATSLRVFPNATYAFSPAIAAAVRGLDIDAVAMAVVGGNIASFSNVARVTVQ